MQVQETVAYISYPTLDSLIDDLIKARSAIPEAAIASARINCYDSGIEVVYLREQTQAEVERNESNRRLLRGLILRSAEAQIAVAEAQGDADIARLSRDLLASMEAKWLRG